MNPLDPQNFYFHLPLYSKIKIENEQDFKNLVQFNGKIDYYNPEIKENTTYKISHDLCNNYHLPADKLLFYLSMRGYTETKAKCTRSDKFYIFYLFYDKKNETLQKIGQYPSIADYDISQIKNMIKFWIKLLLRSLPKL